MSRTNLTWLIVVVGTAIVSTACQFLAPIHADSSFALIVENHRREGVKLFFEDDVYGIPGIAIDPCSLYTFGSMPYNPGQPVKMDVRDQEGRTILTIQQVPKAQKFGGRDELTVIIPSSIEGECPEIRVISTPTPTR